MSASSNNGLSGLASWATSAATNAGFSMAWTVGSSVMKTVANKGAEFVNKTFGDAPVTAASYQTQRRPSEGERYRRIATGPNKVVWDDFNKRADALAERLAQDRTGLSASQRLAQDRTGLPASQSTPESTNPQSPVVQESSANDDFLDNLSPVKALAIGALILVAKLHIDYMEGPAKVVPVKVAAKTSWLPSQGKILFTAGVVAVAWFAVKPQLQKIPQFQQFLNWMDSE